MAAITEKRMKDRLAQISGEQDRLSKLAEAYLLVIADIGEQEKDIATASSPGQQVDDAIHAILLAEGKSLHRNEIYRQLVAQGITIAGQKPISNVGAHLSLDPRFKSVGEGRWGLAVWDIIMGASLNPADFDKEASSEDIDREVRRILGNR